MWLGRAPKGSYSLRGHSGNFLETPFSEPRRVLRTLFYCKTHSKPPSKNPSENPSPEPFPEPFLEHCVAVRPLRRTPKWHSIILKDFGCCKNLICNCYLNNQFSDFLFPLQAPTPYPDNPPPLRPLRTWFWSISVRFGSVSVHFGSVSGPSWGVGSGRGGVVERGFCKGNLSITTMNLLKTMVLAVIISVARKHPRHHNWNRSDLNCCGFKKDAVFLLLAIGGSLLTMELFCLQFCLGASCVQPC